MSSFLDRWLYKKTASHAAGNSIGNTGSYYSTKTMSTNAPKQSNYTPQVFTSGPNTTNTPFRYFITETEKVVTPDSQIRKSSIVDITEEGGGRRKSSISSMSSDESN